MFRKWIILLAFCCVAAAGPVGAVRCLRGPYLQNAAVGSIEIRWELNQKGPCSLEYSTGAEAPQRVASPFQGRKHRVRLTGLRPGERYRYRIWFKKEQLTDEYEFRATPSGPARFTFAVFGDFGAGTKGQLGVAKLLEDSPAEFALLPGDMVYGRGEDEHYDLRFFQPYRRSLRRMTFWPALGNHDVAAKDGAAALAVFDVPSNGPPGVQTGRNYSFDYGNAHIASLDSNANATLLRQVIGPWLERDMAPSSQTWKFVFLHHPPFSSASHGETLRIRDVLVPIFTRSRVDIVFAGHDHAYERIHPRDGVTYIVSGNGGANLYPHRNPHDYTAVFYNQKHGLTLVTVDGERLLLRHINVDGKEIDRLELEKASSVER
jgi:calcineurin-like phosphoesterase family protein